MKFFTPGRLFVVAAFCATLGVRAADEWQTQVVGVMITAPEGGKDNRSYCWKPGVTVSVRLTPPTGKIVQLNEEKSKIDSFSDDKGTDVMAGVPSKDPFNKPGISFMLPSAPDGYASVIIDLKASGLPAKGATNLNISGRVKAQVAEGTKQATVENVVINTNTQFNLDDRRIGISAAGLKQEAFSKKEEFSVTFSSLKNLDDISSLEFYDAEGNKMEARKRAWGGGFLGCMIEYVFKKKPEHVKIVATVWQNLKTIDVPITIKTGIGF